jgi:basic amino acid/polyamine antiporter, APA family
MSSTADTRAVPQPPGGQERPEPSGGEKQAGGLSPVSATALVIGSIIGTGVFTMPAVLAAGGTSSLGVLAVVGVGAMMLAVLFGQLTRRVPNSAGGLYAYAKHEYGDFAGFVTGWSYWISSWAGDAAIVASWVFYVNALFGIRRPSGWTDWGIALLGLWVPAAINLISLRQVAWFQNVTVVLKFLPLLFIGVVGWFFIKAGNFGPFNASGGSLYSAIGIAASVAVFSFIGVEVAAITAKRVKNPRKNVGRASVLGTGISAILYLLVSAVVMGLVPPHALAGNGAPFVDAYQAMFPHGTWAGKLIAATAVISALGALNGWTLVTAEVSRAPADDGLFPGAFGWTDRKGNAWFGVVIAAVLPSLLMLWRYTSGTGLTVFTYLVDLTVVTVAIPYLFSACAQLTFLVSQRRPVHGWVLARDLLVVVISVLFSVWVNFSAGYQAVYQALVIVLLGVIVYAVLNGHRERTGRIPQPADNPPDDTPADAPAAAGQAPGSPAGQAPAATRRPSPPPGPDTSDARR